MSAYRESDTGDAEFLPHCVGLAYAGRRALEPAERELLAARIRRVTWQALGLALAVPAGLVAALTVAARSGSATLVVIFGAAFAVGTITSWTVAVERTLYLRRLRKDQRRGEVSRFEGVLPHDVLEDPDARRLGGLGLLREGVETSVELLPYSTTVWRAHDVLVELPGRLHPSRNIRARRT